jgi:hypothetical protein
MSITAAAIVRPDGFVAWRTKDSRRVSKAVMSDVMSSLLCRNGQAQAAAATG